MILSNVRWRKKLCNGDEKARLMVIVIDAYNVLKQKKTDYISQAERERFIALLDAYAQRKKHEITVVFDGGTSDRLERMMHGLVTIIYSGGRSTADDIIVNLIPRLHVNNALIVTSDRAICKCAYKYQVPTIDPGVFTFYVEREQPESQVEHVPLVTQAVKIDKTVSISWFDKLMEQASRVILNKDSENLAALDDSPRMLRRTRSKQEKKLDIVIKKL